MIPETITGTGLPLGGQRMVGVAPQLTLGGTALTVNATIAELKEDGLLASVAVSVSVSTCPLVADAGANRVTLTDCDAFAAKVIEDWLTADMKLLESSATMFNVAAGPLLVTMKGTTTGVARGRMSANGPGWTAGATDTNRA
jgi:hypothetical protein